MEQAKENVSESAGVEPKQHWADSRSVRRMDANEINHDAVNWRHERDVTDWPHQEARDGYKAADSEFRPIQKESEVNDEPTEAELQEEEREQERVRVARQLLDDIGYRDKWENIIQSGNHWDRQTFSKGERLYKFTSYGHEGQSSAYWLKEVSLIVCGQLLKLAAGRM